MNTEDREILRKAAEDRLKVLEAKSYDKPPHHQLVLALKAAWKGGKDYNAVPIPRGVSHRVYDAIVEDFEWIEYALGPEEIQGNYYRFPDAYQNRRVTDARATAQRRRTQEQNEPGLHFDNTGNGRLTF